MNSKVCVKGLALPVLQDMKLRCVFCGVSNQEVVGGYFKNKFVCHNCDLQYLKISSLVHIDDELRGVVGVNQVL